MNWNNLIFGTYSQKEIATAVNNASWQAFRESMIGSSLRSRYARLHKYLSGQNHSAAAKIRVTNYVNALKRGGLID